MSLGGLAAGGGCSAGSVGVTMYPLRPSPKIVVRSGCVAVKIAMYAQITASMRSSTDRNCDFEVAEATCSLMAIQSGQA